MTTTTTEKKRALGRGLESLIPAARAAAPAPLESGEVVRQVAVEAIEPNPYQPRRRYDEAALAELTASVRAQGILQPIVLRYISPGDGQSPRYQLIAGERRWRAAQRAGLAAVPALVRQVSNEQAMELALIENLQREDLGAMEMARAFERLSREFGLTQEQMAARTGKDRASIANYLRLLRLPEDVQAQVERAELSFGHARALMALEEAKLISGTAEEVIKRALSVRQTEQLVREMLDLRLPGESEQKEKPPRPVDPNVHAAETELERRLGVRVRIYDRKGKGRVVLEYKTLEDFDRIIEALK